METYMRGLVLFFAGILVGSTIQIVVAQSTRPALALNHVAIAVPDLDEGIRFYTKALGLKEAFTFKDNRGTPLSYLQISRDTFLELQPATSERPVGLIHVGLEVGDLRSSLPRFKQGGLQATDPNRSVRTNALISQATGLADLRFELLEFGPDSLQRKVMDSWK
jgi:catechol 2,3-dioxygenase-like lactoylglutathione lyase family enzyme